MHTRCDVILFRTIREREREREGGREGVTRNPTLFPKTDNGKHVMCFFRLQFCYKRGKTFALTHIQDKEPPHTEIHQHSAQIRLCLQRMACFLFFSSVNITVSCVFSSSRREVRVLLFWNRRISPMPTISQSIFYPLLQFCHLFCCLMIIFFGR